MLYTFAKANDFDKAVEAHRQGRFAEAEAIYQQVLAQNPNHADAIHMQGLLHHQKGDRAKASQLIERSIALLPTNPTAYSNLAEVKRCLGLPQDAEKLCRQAIAMNPNMSAAYVNLALALHQMGRASEGLPHALRAIELGPREAGGYSAAALCLAEMQRIPEAIRYFEETLKLLPNDAMIMSSLALCYVRVEMHQKAIETMKRAVDLAPDNMNILMSMGIMMAQLEKFHDSAQWFEKVLQIKPDFMPAIEHLAGVRTGQKRFEDAIVLCRRIMQANPNALDVAANMGEAMMNLGQFDETIVEMKRVLAIKKLPSILQSLSNAYARTARPDEALQHINEAVALDPQNAVLHFNKSIILMLMGRYRDAWPEYEWRWQHPRMVGRTRRFSVPQWDGRPLNGARILLHAEQGMGDTIFFGRYAKLIAEERGGKPVLWVQTSIVEVAKTIPGVEQVVGESGPIPQVDYHIPIMSLPRIFNTAIETIPTPIPYIKSEPVRAAYWKEELARRTKKFKVGLVWEGGAFQPENFLRSASLPAYAPLADVPGVTFFGLQKGPAEIQSKTPPEGMDFHDLAPHIKDFADTTAILDNLDLLVSIDTSVLHFAAALGKPVWMFLAYSPGHMWMYHREDTPWYPNIKIYRQPAFKDWATPVGRVKKDLIALLQREGRI
jgi:tetratricopeptide (TPR) repeat protein